MMPAACTMPAVWSQWEGACLSLMPDQKVIDKFGDDHFALAFASIECHYFVNKGFMSHDGALLDGMNKIAHLPGIIVQGRYDVVTPPSTGIRIGQALAAAQLQIIPDAGHTSLEPGIADATHQGHRSYFAPEPIRLSFMLHCVKSFKTCETLHPSIT